MRRGLSQGGRWLFKKSAREEKKKKKKLAEVPPSGSSALLFSRSDAKPPPSQSCRSLTSDVSKIPNAPIGLQTPRPKRKSKDLGLGNSDLSHTPSKSSGTGEGLQPPRAHCSPPPPPSVRLPRTPTPPPPGVVRSAKFREISKRGMTAGRRECGRESPEPAACSAELTARLCIRRSHLESGHQAHRWRRRLRSARGCPAECPPVGPGSGSRRGRGGAGAPRGGGGGGGGRGRGAQEGGPRARGAIFFAFSRELLTSRLCN